MIWSVTKILTKLEAYACDPVVYAMIKSWLYANRIYQTIFDKFDIEIRKHVTLRISNTTLSTGSIRRTYIVTAGWIRRKEFRISEIIYPKRRRRKCEEEMKRAETTRSAA